MKKPVFESPQWAWKREYEQRDFAGVSNAIEMERLGDTESLTIYVSIPSGFFKYAREVLKLSREDIETVSFYFDQISTKEWVLGFDVESAHYYIDLWSYTTSTLPAWIRGGNSQWLAKPNNAPQKTKRY